MDNNGNHSSHWNERSAIHYRMNQLQGELKAVRDEYERLFDRLRDLDRIEMQQHQHQFNPFMQPAPPSLHSETEIQPLQDVPDEKTGTKSELRQTVEKDIENTTKNKAKNIMNSNVINEVLAGLQRGKPKEKKSKDNSSSSKGQRYSQSVKTSNKSAWSKKEEIKARKELIIQTLKEGDMRAKDISKLLEENGFKINNITIILNELAKVNPEIQRIDRGIYGWKEVQLREQKKEIQGDESEDESTDKSTVKGSIEEDNVKENSSEEKNIGDTEKLSEEVGQESV